jgi:hypothetical protein
MTKGPWPSIQCLSHNARTYSSAATASSTSGPDFQDLEAASSLMAPGLSQAETKSFDPVKRASRRQHQLPPSRYCSTWNPSIGQANNIIQIPIQISKILPRTSPSSSTTPSFRSILTCIRSWPLHRPSPRTNMGIYRRLRPHDPHILPYRPRYSQRTESAPSPRVG